MAGIGQLNQSCSALRANALALRYTNRIGHFSAKIKLKLP
jgi:hypothetical protein